MRPIEKLADSYVSDVKSSMEADGVDMSGRVAGLCLRMVKKSFIRGMEQMREELTRWHDPDDPPSDDRDVLVKTTSCQKYEIAFFKAKGFRNYHWHTNNGPIDDDMVIGWREIYE